MRSLNRKLQACSENHPNKVRAKLEDRVRQHVAERKEELNAVQKHKNEQSAKVCGVRPMPACMSPSVVMCVSLVHSLDSWGRCKSNWSTYPTHTA